MLARSTVVWVQRWQADETASLERMKAGAGEWVGLALAAVSTRFFYKYHILADERVGDSCGGPSIRSFQAKCAILSDDSEAEVTITACALIFSS